MQQSMGSLANSMLIHVFLPVSHNADIGTFSSGTVGAHFANTQTQYMEFEGHLIAGSCYAVDNSGDTDLSTKAGDISSTAHRFL